MHGSHLWGVPRKCLERLCHHPPGSRYGLRLPILLETTDLCTHPSLEKLSLLLLASSAFLFCGIFPAMSLSLHTYKKTKNVFFSNPFRVPLASLIAQLVKNPPAMQGIPESGRSTSEGIGYSLQYSWASLVAQLVKNLPAMRETWVWSLGWEDPLENRATYSGILAWRILGTVWGCKESDVTERLSLSGSILFWVWELNWPRQINKRKAYSFI